MKALGTGRWRYIDESEKDLPKEQQTVFWLKNVGSRTFGLVMDSCDMRTGEVNLSGTMGRLICAECLVDWENFTGDEGKQIPFPDKIEAALDLIPGEARTRMARRIFDQNRLGEQDRKN